MTKKLIKIPRFRTIESRFGPESMERQISKPLLPFSPSPEGSSLVPTFLSFPSIPDCAVLPSLPCPMSNGKQITILFGSKNTGAFHQSAPIPCPSPMQYRSNWNSVKGRGGGLPTPPSAHANGRHLANCCPSAGGLAGGQRHGKRPLFILLTHKNI